jgi:hypothetical protein
VAAHCRLTIVFKRRLRFDLAEMNIRDPGGGYDPRWRNAVRRWG